MSDDMMMYDYLMNIYFDDIDCTNEYNEATHEEIWWIAGYYRRKIERMM